MTKKGFTMEMPDENCSRALLKDQNVSPKMSFAISKAIKGMNTEQAKEYLEDVINAKKPVPITRYVTGIAHKRGHGFGAGRYPKKAAQSFVQLIELVEANAEFNGQDPEHLDIIHIAAHRAKTWHSWFPRAHGRSTPKKRERVNLEIIVKEAEEAE
jgi:large subunit ribosomal protein L22